MSEVAEIWSYLSREPLMWLTATVVVYLVGDAIFRGSGRNPLVNPVLIAVVILALVLVITDTRYEDYFEGAQFVHFMLGPATVAMAVPLRANLDRVRATIMPILAALLGGSLVAVIVAIGTAAALGLDGATLLSLAPKSATAPVAIGVAEVIGGSPTLTAMLVILTGITGAIVVTPLFNAMGLKDWRARGFAVGVAAHGIGTARAFQVNETAGAFAGIGMALNAMLTAIMVPVLIRLLGL